MSINSNQHNDDSGTQAYLRLATALLAQPKKERSRKPTKPIDVIPLLGVVEVAAHPSGPHQAGAVRDEANGPPHTDQDPAGDPNRAMPLEPTAETNHHEVVKKITKWDTIERHKRTLAEIIALPQVDDGEPQDVKKNRDEKSDKKRIRRDREIIAFGVVLNVPKKLAVETKKIIRDAPFGPVLKTALQRVSTVKDDEVFTKAFRKLNIIFSFIKRELPKPTKARYEEAGKQLFLPIYQEPAK